MAEDMHVENDLASANTTSILVAQTPVSQTPGLSSTAPHPSGQPSSGPILPTPSSGSSGPYQFPFPPQQYYPSFGGNHRSNRNNSRFNNRNQSSNFNQYPSQYPSQISGGCQICGKSNHLTYSCYHRQNLAYRPNLGNPTGGYSGNSGSNYNAKPPGYTNNNSGNHSYSGYGGNAGYGIGQPSGYGGTTGYNSGQGHNAQVMFASPDIMGYYGQMPGDFNGQGSNVSAPTMFPQQQPQINANFGSPSDYSSAAQSVTPWFFDSGATSHVTHDSSHIQTPHGGIGTSAVTVGNGQSIPVANSGPIDSSLQKLQKLSEINLSSNNLTSHVPGFFANFQNLTVLTPEAQFFEFERNFSRENFPPGVVLSTHFEGLLNLVYIDLSHNSFNASIPSSLFSLPSLNKILLSNNKFSGQITGFPNVSLSPLDTLDLSSNRLEGPIPSYFFDFRRLNILSVSFNYFNGTMELGIIQGLQNLTRLELSYNKLTVDVSANISSLSSFPQLTVLNLASCNLRECPALMNQSRVIHLDLSDNKISGVIPNWIWNVRDGKLVFLNLSCNLLVGLQSVYIMPSLGILDLHSNQLGGGIPLPPETAIYVDHSGNKFNSSIPGDIGNHIAFANFLSLSDNMLSGLIPPSICNGSYLKVLDLSTNRLSGTIPRCLIDNSTETLGILNLGNNNLSGYISGTFPQGCALNTLDLNRNHLEGPVPESLLNCANLEVLNLGSNKMNDNFTCFLKNLSKLRVLVLRSNDFHGGIRCRGVNNSTWQKLQIIDISYNNFSGDLPPEYFLLWNAMMIDGSNPKAHCRGPDIPST
ncbi:hypothetical protein Vadar_034632 [Vaccinium darrowii]|uniref:Uncharacterized protein n=1 Tax=Vaccinium darrowii TaxID=229202 RepID=A0ACB7ZPM8_9ERIC|nr:hypothetical protein Vadar_034632 [Vaccinium darrowii]